MGNIFQTQQSDVKSDVNKLNKIAADSSKRAISAGNDANTAVVDVNRITSEVTQAAGSDPINQQIALMRSRELARAQDTAQEKIRIYQELTIASQQASATAAALARLEGRKTTENVYSCPAFSPCTGTPPYNATRASGIANDYNRKFARTRGDIFTRPETITDGGDNACNISGTFLDRVNDEYRDEKRKFQYNCDADRGWQLESVSSIEGMLGRMSY